MNRWAAGIQRQLNGGTEGNVWQVPAKPRGMHERTYHRLVMALLGYQMAATREHLTANGRLIAWLGRLTSEDGMSP